MYLGEQIDEDLLIEADEQQLNMDNHQIKAEIFFSTKKILRLLPATGRTYFDYSSFASSQSSEPKTIDKVLNGEERICREHSMISTFEYHSNKCDNSWGYAIL